MYVNVTRIERDERSATGDNSRGREYKGYGEILGANPIEIAAHRNKKDVEGTPPTVSQVRPWVRYFARSFDIWFFSVLVAITLSIFAPSVLDIPGILLTIGILFVWIFQEAILLANCGTTPGKWLFNIRIRDSKGQKLQFSDALNRSFSLWLNGMGAGIPFISFITLLSSRSKLKRDGLTAWDEQGGFAVTHGKIGALKSVAIAMTLLGIFSLNAWANYVEREDDFGPVGSYEELYTEEDYGRLIELLREADTTEPREIVTVQSSAPVQRQPNFVVEGIVWSSDRPAALIGGHIVRKGDSICGARIVRVTRKSVEFEIDGRSWRQGVSK